MQTSRRKDLFLGRVQPQKEDFFQTLTSTHHTTICHILESKVQFYVDYHKNPQSYQNLS